MLIFKYWINFNWDEFGACCLLCKKKLRMLLKTFLRQYLSAGSWIFEISLHNIRWIKNISRNHLLIMLLFAFMLILSSSSFSPYLFSSHAYYQVNAYFRETTVCKTMSLKIIFYILMTYHTYSNSIFYWLYSIIHNDFWTALKTLLLILDHSFQLIPYRR